MPTVPPDRLAALLTAHAKGYYATEAATDLLIGHGTWLQRSDFLAACVFAWDHHGNDLGSSVWASPSAADLDDTPTIAGAGVDWDAIPGYLTTAGASGSETRILRLVAELAGTDTGTPLSELLSSLDDHNSALVVVAIAHALHLTGDPPEAYYALRRVDGAPIGDDNYSYYLLALDDPDAWADELDGVHDPTDGPIEVEVVCTVMTPVARHIYPPAVNREQGQ